MARTRRRGTGALVALLVLLVLAGVVVGGLVVADRRIHAKAEQQTAQRLQSDLGTPAPPTVVIEGSPFLTQVASGTLRTVRVSADGLGATNDAKLVIRHADLVLSDVTSEDRFQTMNVSHLDGQAQIDYAELQRIAGVPLTYVGGGRFRTESSTSVFGQQVKAEVTGTLDLDVAAQTIQLGDPKVSVAGIDLPDAVAQALIRAVVHPIAIGALPYGVKVAAIDPRDDGLYATVAGENLPLSR